MIKTQNEDDNAINVQLSSHTFAIIIKPIIPLHFIMNYSKKMRTMNYYLCNLCCCCSCGTYFWNHDVTENIENKGKLKDLM